MLSKLPKIEAAIIGYGVWVRWRPSVLYYGCLRMFMGGGIKAQGLSRCVRGDLVVVGAGCVRVWLIALFVSRSCT